MVRGVEMGGVMKLRVLGCVALGAVVFSACGGQPGETARFASVSDGRFIDTFGREIILHGTNVIDKTKKNKYLSWHGPEEFAQMRAWGFNCVRLGLIWDGLEPEPGQYNDEYLAGIDERIQWAKQNGMYVVLDMHQDLFSAKYGADGAPAWACLDDGKAVGKSAGHSWGTTYIMSAALHTAFESFWDNRSGPGDVGIQDRFASAWQHVAARYAEEEAVIGYDLFNEPFIGSGVLGAAGGVLPVAAEIIGKSRGTEPPSGSELIAEATTPEGGANMLKLLEDPAAFSAILDAAQGAFHGFEKGKLASMYQRVGDAIRVVDTNHLIFLEGHIFCSVGVRSGIEPRCNAAGERDPLLAYAPHAYDLVTDTADVANASAARIEVIFDRLAATGKRLGMPPLVGEWGAYPGRPGMLPAAKDVVRQLEKLMLSDTYWQYSSQKSMEGGDHLPMLARPYPAAVAGRLTQIHSDYDAREFTCAWREDPAIKEPTRIYVAAEWFGTDEPTVVLEPAGSSYSFERIADGVDSTYLVIPPAGGEVERRLILKSAAVPGS